MQPSRILLWTAATLALLVALPSGALASENTTMNESEFDTEPPQGDDSYLKDDDPWSEPSGDGNSTDSTSGDASTTDEGSTTDETSSGNESTLNESEFDTTLPTYDDSFLDVAWLEDSETPPDASDSASRDGGKTTPPRDVPALAPFLAVLGGALVAVARRR